MKQAKNKIFGFTLLFVSGLLVGKYMGIVDMSTTTIIISGLFVVILLNSLLNSYRKENRWLNIALTLVFLVILSDQLILDHRLFPGVGIMPLIFAGLLFSFGVHFLLDKKDNTKNKSYYKNYHEDYTHENTSSSQDEVVNIDSSMSSSTYYVTSKLLKRVNASNNMGELKIYLNQQELDDNAIININNRLGSTTIYISKNINVYCSIKGVLSSTNTENVFNNEESNQKINIIGSNVLGSVEIVVI